MKAHIQFRAKVTDLFYVSGESAGKRIQVPTLKRCHCDMREFRQHPKYGSYANSDLFEGMLRGIRSSLFGESGVLKLDSIPDGVTVDTSGFLAQVTIEV
jgi:hypothetical protein